LDEISMALIPPVTRRIMAGDLNEMFNSLIDQINKGGGRSGGTGLTTYGPPQTFAINAKIPVGFWLSTATATSIVLPLPTGNTSPSITIGQMFFSDGNAYPDGATVTLIPIK
jgi:hypothetical protein